MEKTSSNDRNIKKLNNKQIARMELLRGALPIDKLIEERKPPNTPSAIHVISIAMSYSHGLGTAYNVNQVHLGA